MWFVISEAGMDPVSRPTNTLLAGGRGRSGVEVGPDQIRVQMGGFKLTVPRASIRSASRSQENVRGTYGVHSRSGRWLVNGSPVRDIPANLAGHVILNVAIRFEGGDETVGVDEAHEK